MSNFYCPLWRYTRALSGRPHSVNRPPSIRISK